MLPLAGNAVLRQRTRLYSISEDFSTDCRTLLYSCCNIWLDIQRMRVRVRLVILALLFRYPVSFQQQQFCIAFVGCPAPALLN